jgi:epoxyqueuosine reductase
MLEGAKIVKNALKEFCLTLNIKDVGIASAGPYQELEERWSKRLAKGHITGFEEQDINRRINPKLTLESAKSVIVCLFPYLIGCNETSNLSKSSFSEDYHLIIKNKLDMIGKFLENKISGFEYKAFVDSGPLADRFLAYKAGLGYFGMNSHIITDQYGSYVFIGYIINNFAFEPDQPLDKTCMKCGACVKSCPGGAILGNFDINPLVCRSYLTQKKGELSELEIKILKKDSLVFGCDICQDVCPHNINVKCTPILEFTENIKDSIAYQELQEISNKEFKRRYGNRNFSWRGKGLLIRNFKILNADNK